MWANKRSTAQTPERALAVYDKVKQYALFFLYIKKNIESGNTMCMQIHVNRTLTIVYFVPTERISGVIYETSL
jgi:hypothetical protein